MTFKTKTTAALLLSVLTGAAGAETILTIKPETLECGRRFTLEGTDNCELKFSVEVTTDNTDKDYQQIFGSCRTVLRLYMPPEDNPGLRRLLGFPSREPQTPETRDETFTHDFNLFARYGRGTAEFWQGVQFKPTGSTVISASIVRMDCQQEP